MTANKSINKAIHDRSAVKSTDYGNKQFVRYANQKV